MRKIILGVSSVVIAAVGSLSNTALGQNISQVGINSITYGGDGCPQGTLSSKISATQPGSVATDLLILFPNTYKAVQGKNVSLSERRKSCNIAINFEIPQGFQFSISNIQHAGYANLPKNVRGVQRTTYSFPFTSSATFQTVLDGLYQGNYQRTDEVGVESVVWSPCGQIAPLTLRTSVTLQGNRQPNASMSLKPISGKIQWRRCSP